MWLIGFNFKKKFPSILFYYMNSFDSHLLKKHSRCLFSNGLNQNLNFKFIKWIFGLNSLTFIWMKKEQIILIVMVLNDKTQIFSSILTFFFHRPPSFLVCLVVIAPKNYLIKIPLATKMLLGSNLYATHCQNLKI